MTAYAIAHLRNPQLNADVVDYIDRIQATLDPFGGRFIVHGGEVDVREGEWPGTIVIIQFPDGAAAAAWYDSPEYQEILPLRTNHIDSVALIINGVPADYDPQATAAKYRALLPT
jgi:uncharacterized protein (DUF1330 family)